MFAMIFGSEKFEPLIGELQIAQMMSMEKGQPSEFLAFKQKRREVLIAINLNNMLKLFAADKEFKTTDLEEDVVELCQELAANPIGTLLISRIGKIYREQAKQENGGLGEIGAHFTEVKSGWSQKAEIASSLYKTYKVAKNISKEEETMPKEQATDAEHEQKEQTAESEE